MDRLNRLDGQVGETGWIDEQKTDKCTYVYLYIHTCIRI